MAEKQDKLFTEFSASTYDEWYEATVKSLKGKPFDKLVKTTYEGFDVQPMYRAEDIADLPHVETLPGQFPYVRGTKTDGYQKWWIAQSINVSDPKAFNEALKHDLEYGQTAINIGENIHFANITDLEIAFADIDLTQYPLLIQADSHAKGIYDLLATYLHDERIKVIRGCIGYDPVHKLASESVVSADIFDLMADHIKFVSDQSPELDTIAIRTDVYHDAGANAVQEMGIALATGVTYLSEMIARGLDVDIVANNICFFLTVGENFFMEVSKLRAIKMMWAQIIREFGGNDESAKMKLHTSTATRNKTRNDPYVNMLRVTTEAMAGAIGGVDSLQVTPFDAPFGESDEFSRRISRNVQLILQDEVNLTNLIDPAGGSWYIEHLTNEVAQSAWDFFQQVEAQGGIIQALHDGFIHSQIQAVVDSRLDKLASRRDVLVGTNMYPNLDETLPKDRNPYQNGVRDISDTLAEHMIQATPLKPIRLSEPFEKLRANSEAFRKANGYHPQIFLANFGALRDYKARMDFTRGFYEVGGFELIDNGGYESVESAVKATVDRGASAVVICSTDDKYAEIVPEFVFALKAKKPDIVVILAGYPADKIEDYRDAGVDDFIHIRANCYDMNNDLQDRLGVGK